MSYRHFELTSRRPTRNFVALFSHSWLTAFDNRSETHLAAEHPKDIRPCLTQRSVAFFRILTYRFIVDTTFFVMGESSPFPLTRRYGSRSLGILWKFNYFAMKLETNRLRWLEHVHCSPRQMVVGR